MVEFPNKKNVFPIFGEVFGKFLISNMSPDVVFDAESEFFFKRRNPSISLKAREKKQSNLPYFFR